MSSNDPNAAIESRQAIDRKGSGLDRPLFRFIAGKLTLNCDSRKLPFVTVPNRPQAAIDQLQ